MRKKRGLQKNSRTAQFLLELDAALDWWILMATQQTAMIKFGNEGTKNLLQRKAFKRKRELLKRLEEQEIIEARDLGDAISAKLTHHGTIQLFRLRVIHANELPEAHYCYVIFDIPETHRPIRDELRSFLRAAGFTQLQRSVWITSKNVFEDLAMLFTIKDASKWVRILKVEEFK